MQKVLYIFISLIVMQSSIFSSEEESVSCCEKLDIYCARLFLKEQDIITHAASLPDPRRLIVCLDLGVGNLYEEDSEGHTPKSVAELCNNQRVLSWFYSPTSITQIRRKKIKSE